MNKRQIRLNTNMIPYFKDLNLITGGILSSLLLQQLDYWFERYPEGFYKFLEPSEHPAYKPGSSWTEELGMTVSEFRTAFDAIGRRFNSKTAFLNAPDKFIGRFFASFIDKRNNVTYYVRNHDVLDQKLSELNALIIRKKDGLALKDGIQVTDFKADDNSQSPVNQIIQSPAPNISRALGNAVSASQEIAFPRTPEMMIPNLHEMESPDLPTTKTTKEIKHNLQTDKTEKITNVGNFSPESSSETLSEILYWPSVPSKQLEQIKEIITFCQSNLRQGVLDEVEALNRAGKIKNNPVVLTKELVRRAALGEFTASAGLKVEEEREASQRLKRALSKPPVGLDVLAAASSGRDDFLMAKSMLKAKSKGSSVEFNPGSGANGSPDNLH